MKEKDAQSRFTAWIRNNKYEKTTVWELKLIKGEKALPYSCFQPQQIPSLLKAKNGCIYKKLSDADPSLKPFDAIEVCHAHAYVVACWYREREYLRAYWIDIERFVAEQESSARKSLTEERAKEIAEKIIDL